MGLNTQNVNLRMTAGFASQFPTDPIPQVALSGRSNVGKSSLINTLLGRKSLARVSSTPGKTITVNFYKIDGKMYIVDLPGYGFAKRPPEDVAKWSALTDGYFTSDYSEGRICAIVQLIDLKVGITKDDAMMLEYMAEVGIPYIIAATKCDKLNKTDMLKNLKALSEHPCVMKGTPIIPFSSLKGTGREELWNEIHKFI